MNHNQFKRVSTVPQANTIPYSDENGNLSGWLENDPVIQALKQQTEFIGTVATAPSPDTQLILTQFVVDETGRAPRSGDEVAIEDVGELWLFNGTQWAFFTTTTLKDATTTSKGVVQIGQGLEVNNGIISLDSSTITAARTQINIDSATPTISSLQENADYVFTNTLTSLALGTIPNSLYAITLTFTTGTGFTFSAPNLTEYFAYNNPPTLLAGKTYKLVIIQSKCHIYCVGAQTSSVERLTVLNPALNSQNNLITWTISNTLGRSDVFIRVFETATGQTVESDSTSTVSTVTLKLYTEEATVAAGTYTAVII